MSAQIEIAKFNFNVDEVLNSAAELEKVIEETKASTKSLKDSQKNLEASGKSGSEGYKENSKAIVENEAKLKALNTEYKSHIQVLTANTTVTKDAASQEKTLNLALGQQVTTIKEARDNNKLLNDIRNNTNTTTKEGQAQITLLNKKLNDNNKLVLENADAYLKQKINIGNYQESIEKALSGVRLFGVSLSDLKGTLTQVTNVLSLVKKDFVDTAKSTKATTAATEGLSGAQKAAFITTQGLVTGLKLLRLALIATGIGAIVVVLGSLITFLATTQEGIDAVTSVTRPLSAVFQTLLGIIQKFGGDVFKDPLGSLIKLRDFVKNQLVESFTGLGKIIAGLFTFDRDKIKEGADQIKKLAEDNAAAIKAQAKGITDQFSEAFKRGQQVDKLTKQLSKSNADFIKSQGQLTEDLKEQNRIAEDQTQSLSDREVAAKKSIDIAKQINLEQTKRLQIERDILVLKAKDNDTSDAEKDEIAKRNAEINASNAQRLELETTQQNKLNAIIKQGQTESSNFTKKTQDEAIAKQKTLLAIYEATGSTIAKTSAEELAQAETVAQKKIEILDKELKAKKISQEDYRLAVLEIDNDLKLRQSEIAIEGAAEELRIYKETIDEKLLANKFLSDEVARQRTEDNNLFLEEQLAFEAEKLKQGLINQTEFDTAVREAKEETRLANEAIDVDREAVKLEEQKALRAISFEEELELLQEEGATRFELQKAQLDEQRAIELDDLNEQFNNELISKDLFEAKKSQLDKKYAVAEANIAKTLAQQKLKALGDTIAVAASVIDKNSAAGKSLGIAQALINTYQGISAGVKLGYPAAIPAVAAAAATGFKAVKEITSQKLPSISGGGDVGGGRGAIASTPGLGADLSSITGQNVNLNNIAASGNSAVQGQIENQASTSGLTEGIAQAVEQGAMAGTSQGAEQGLTNLSDNRQIQQSSTF